MTRSRAREIALGCLFECMIRQCPPEEVLDYRLSGDGFNTLSTEDPIFSEEPVEKDVEYIRGIVAIAYQKSDELFTKITELSVGWSANRISRMTRAILTLSMAEILYRDDVPRRSSINEAVELAKRYDTEKAPSFINGILGKFVRELPAEEDGEISETAAGPESESETGTADN